MSFRDTLIRLAAGSIFFLRWHACRRGDVRILAFSGTSGKTLARLATAHALREAGETVISLPYGYTNELGIILAILGIEEPIRLHSLAGIRRVLTAHAPPNAYVCVEVGADWRKDVRWFTHRFRPYGLFLTALDTHEWARPLSHILGDKSELIRSVVDGGTIILSRDNPSLTVLKSLITENRREHALSEFHIAGDTVHINHGDAVISYPLLQGSEIPAHFEAFGHALAFTAAVPGIGHSSEPFADYAPPESRIAVTKLAGEMTLISDIYKAVPHCVHATLQYALSQPATQRIAVISAMHPLDMNAQAHYRRIAVELARFEHSYFVGPEQDFMYLQAANPRIKRIHEDSYQHLATEIQGIGSLHTQIVLKGAARYRFDLLKTALLSLKDF